MPSSQAKIAPATGAIAPIRVWDMPLRVFHWLLALCFGGAYLSAELDDWRLLHVTLGYTVAGLVLFRLLWGVFGTRYARFSSFVRGPQAVLTYLRGLATGRPQHYTGHNPAGALAIVLMLALALLLTAAGWLLYAELVGDWMEEIHETLANLLLLVVLVHIAAVLLASRLHGENLIRAMWSGMKAGAAGDASQPACVLAALLLLLAVAGFWWIQLG
ncbi:cytochrome b/b6 domain-containing protein [Duganella qianjiadongensis]|uniref:Cytochrome B n=1 Tax=Duganella qianjiadongensis TaxID=2692176 RepID=A0ABW9VE39_9BURK|nr:cytochrome b/b6 domain-containing protein [Duganella qianjiadongensis]MYM37889.1 cytochrome B [Duganella qianjiadongensis]